MTKLPLLLVTIAALGLLVSPSATAESVTHVVERGQTIYSIARRYGIPQAIIIAENNIADPRSVPVGTALVIPGVYRVERGDSYYGIARRFGVELEELLSTNDRSADTLLREGEVLVLPTGARSMELAAEASRNTERSDADGSSPSETEESVESQDILEPRDMVLHGNADVSESWPLSGTRSPLSGKLPGVMIRGDIGDEVRSVASGRVRYTGTYSAFGRVVMVQSPEGYLYVYGGTDRVIVDVGDLVTEGALLGVLGQGPHSSDPALYFSVFKGDVPVRPEDAPRG